MKKIFYLKKKLKLVLHYFISTIFYFSTVNFSARHEWCRHCEVQLLSSRAVHCGKGRETIPHWV